MSNQSSERYAVLVLKTQQNPLHINESIQGELVWQLQHGILKDWSIEYVEVCNDVYQSEFLKALTP